MTRRIDLTGKTFGRLTALQYAGVNGSNGDAFWLCQCACGKQVVVNGYRLRHGITHSCGCLRNERSAERVKHNASFMKNVGRAESFGIVNGVNVEAALVKSRLNHSGTIGVSFDTTNQVWVARLMVKGRYVLNRRFRTQEEAIAARRAAEREYLAPVILSGLECIGAKKEVTKFLKQMD